MRPTSWPRALTTVAMVLGAFGCGGDSTEIRVPTAEQLAADLVVATDYSGEWTVLADPDGGDDSGVVPDDQRQMLPTMDLCDAASAASRAAADGLMWAAFRQLNLAVDDPIQAPDHVGHMIFVQEFLLADEPQNIETTFGLLRDGLQACLGDIPADEEGPGAAVPMALPTIGDDRYGVLITIQEAGDTTAEWRLHNALVRVGAVLVMFDVVEITAGEGVQPNYSIEDVANFVEVAIDKL